jgi:hypothetical protein
MVVFEIGYYKLKLHQLPYVSPTSKSGRWFQSDLSINSERYNLVAPAPSS